MQLKQFLSDDTAVSPVIGVILMVAITVILAALTGAFVLGAGEQQQEVPQAAFEYDYNGTVLEITHSGGDTFQSSNTARLVVKYVPDGSTTATELLVPLPFDAQDSVSVTPERGTEVEVIWTSPRSDRSHIVSDYDVE